MPFFLFAQSIFNDFIRNTFVIMIANLWFSHWYLPYHTIFSHVPAISLLATRYSLVLKIIEFQFERRQIIVEKSNSTKIPRSVSNSKRMLQLLSSKLKQKPFNVVSKLKMAYRMKRFLASDAVAFELSERLYRIKYMKRFCQGFCCRHSFCSCMSNFSQLRSRRER